MKKKENKLEKKTRNKDKNLKKNYLLIFNLLVFIS